MPGSQREGCIEVPTSNAEGEDNWLHNVSADLKYRIDDDKVASFARSYGLTAPKGLPGSILFFHCNIVHGSPSNISPYPRRMIILTYNAIDNAQCSDGPPSPEFLVGRDFHPLEPLQDNLF